MADDRSIDVKPMTKKIRYKNHVIEVEYDPNAPTNKWRWAFVHTPNPLRFSGAATTMPVAERDAKKEVDKLTSGLGQ